MKGGTMQMPAVGPRPAPQGGPVMPVGAGAPGSQGPQPPSPPLGGQAPQPGGSPPQVYGADFPARARQPHPLMAPMYWAASDVLLLAPHLYEGGTSLPSPDVLRHRVKGMLATMGQRAYHAGIPPEDVRDAQYALVALIDEMLLRSRWTQKVEWNLRPLQMSEFNENTAGEGFFLRLRALESQPHRVHVLQVYFLCLAQGFQGSYAVSGSGEGLQSLLERIGELVGRATVAPEPISPHGETSDLGRNLLYREAPLVRLAIAIAIAGLLTFLALRVWMGATVSAAVQPMHEYAASTPTAPP